MSRGPNIFLLIGQSNMAGRGRLDEVALLRDPEIVMFRDGCWTAAEEPLHTDRPAIAGIGLGMSFAVKLRELGYPGSIGLVPCAFGGTPLSRWMPQGDLYGNALAITRLALSEGTLKGILWHQGESDSGNLENAKSYGERFQEMVTQMRADLSSPGLTVIAGELGAFLRDNRGCEFYDVINQQLCGLERGLDDYACVTSEGLTDNGDTLHFNAESLREFGRRYAARYMALP